MEENNFQLNNVTRQYWAALIANLVMLGHGAVVGWFSPSVPILISDETPLVTGPLSNEELSWLGAINNLGALGGILTFGVITQFLGCKKSMLLLTFPSAAFWVFVYFGNTYHHILFARFFTGWSGGGINTTIVLYISEIANDSIRGRLGSIGMLLRNIGVLMIFVAGAVFDYKLVPCIFIFIPMFFLVLFFKLPNTPQYYLQKGLDQKAENALKFYKGYKGKTEHEVNAFQKEFERLKLLAKEQKADKNIRFSDFLEKQAIKGLLFGIMLAWLMQFPGTMIFLNYGTLIFEKTGTTQIDPYMSSIMLAVAQIVGGILSTQLADSFGRKFLIVISFLGSAIALFILSVYLYLIENGYDVCTTYSWVPVACLSFVMFITSAGIFALLSVCYVEYLPTKIRTIGLTICVLFNYSFVFLFIKIFPILLNIIGLNCCIMILTIGNLIGTIFVIFALDETRGKTLDKLKSENS